MIIKYLIRLFTTHVCFTLIIISFHVIQTQAVAANYTTSNNKIYKNGQQIVLKGVNYFGFESLESGVVQGLWTSNVSLDNHLDKIQSLGFNALRIPICNLNLYSTAVPVGYVNPTLNPAYAGKTAIQRLDLFLANLEARKIFFMLDHHDDDCNYAQPTPFPDLWYSNSMSEEQWIKDLEFVANRYKDKEYFAALDLKNEPHDRTTWGDGNTATDFRLAAIKASQRVRVQNPNILIFVEGIGENNQSSVSGFNKCTTGVAHFWGENLQPVECYPILDSEIPKNKLVLSPHVYGPDVYNQPYFQTGDFPNNMNAIWETKFGFLLAQGYTIAPGEWGGKYGEALASDKVWQDKWVDYQISKGICNNFHWSYNPTSGDTGGVVADDWTTVKTGKVANIQRLQNAAICQPTTVTPTLKTITTKIKLTLNGTLVGGVVSSKLGQNGLIPTTNPYGLSGSFTTANADYVDWVAVELYNKATNTLIQSRAMLASKGIFNNYIIDPTNGNSNVLTFGNIDFVTNPQIEIRIRHRNHLRSIVSTVITDVNYITIPEFNQVMLPCDINNSNAINSADRNAIKTQTDKINVYNTYDVNLDGSVTSKDRLLGKGVVDVVG
jgi:aryl-phospho-beta-D-glucosidase BglC (GH1 family)